GVLFHDGTGFDADDVKFSLDRALSPESSNAQKAMLRSIVQVNVLDPLTVELLLDKPAGNIPFVLGWGDAVIVAPESAGNNATQPIGTGPFLFFSWRRGDSIQLSRNENYWGSPANIDGVEFKFIGDPAAAFASIKAGDIDAYPNYPAPENIRQFESDADFKVMIGASEGKVILAVNNRNAPFNDRLVRRAISHAIDREAIVDGAFFGYGQAIGSHYTRHSQAYLDLIQRYPFDLVLAKSLLAKAGYPDGFEASLRLPPRPYARRAGEVIAAQLARIGIRLKIENLEWAQWLEQVFKQHEFDLTIVEHIEPMDYGIYARNDYYFGYNSAEFQTLFEQSEVEIDLGIRDSLLQAIQKKIAHDAVNVFLVQSAKLGVWKAGISGLWINSPIPANIAANVKFENGPVVEIIKPSEKSSHSTLLSTGLISLSIILLVLMLRQVGVVYLLEKIASHGLTLAAASLVIFLLIQIVPGDPAAYMMGMNASPESIAALREQMGLDRSAVIRYLDWVGGLLRGEFGVSYTYNMPVGTLISERLEVSAPLALLAMILSLVIALPVGVLAASRRGSILDTFLNMIMQIGVALPNFWIALLLILVFSTQLHWFAAGGFVGWDAGLIPALKGLLLPAVALAAPQAAIIARVLRTALLDTMSEDYARTARAKGLNWNQALWRHALRNAMIPVLTIIGLQLPFLLAGGIIIENIFSLPGIGRLVFQAITQRDLIVVQSVVIVLVFAVVSVTFLIDLAYLTVDPRLRNSSR
ncbi:MAG: ABC transporter permease subunit, partial [Pseudomonadales bacterium]|nr:ABC transporter permease subunit [Pseudomonadales bacterium]